MKTSQNTLRKRVLMTLSLKDGDRMQLVPHSHQGIPLNCCLKKRRMVKRDKHQNFNLLLVIRLLCLLEAKIH
jgi:hypothetical protein